MLEKIIIAPSANEAELLRTLAAYGVNTLGVRIMSSVKLAEYALMHSGIAVIEKYADSSAQTALIYSILDGIPLFESAAFPDAQNIAAALNTVRGLIPENEDDVLHDKLSKGEFPENSTALTEVYDRYIAVLKENNLIDGIQLIRRAAQKASVIKADIIVLEEFTLTAAEQNLVDKISGVNCRYMPISELFGVPEKTMNYAEITEAYSEVNEIENIISWIYESGIPLDKCTVAVADTSKYPQLIYDIASRYNIPVAFGCGLPIRNAFPAQLLRNYYDWKTSGYCGVDALKRLIFDSSFDRNALLESLGIENISRLNKMIEVAGNLRISDDNNTNQKRISDYGNTFPKQSKMTELLKKFADELERGCAYFVCRYAYIRKDECGRIDCAALNAIDREIAAYTLFTGGDPVDVIPNILSRNVLSENSHEGCLHVCTLSQAKCSMRENLFITGLSASNFPGAPTENYLVSDNDMLLFGEDAPTSEKIISDRKKQLYKLLEFAASLDTKIHLSYSGFSAADLKDENASSVLFEIYSQCHGGDSDMDTFTDSLLHTGFFDSDISPSRLLGRAYNSSAKISPDEPIYAEELPVRGMDIVLSPSAVDDYHKCPVMFYYKRILGLKVPEKDDVFVILDGLTQGNLIHDLMKYAADMQPDTEAFYAEANRTFDSYITSRPPLNEPELNKIKHDFLHMAEVGYYFVKKNESVTAEKDVGPVEINGITLSGRLDSLEKTLEGKYIIGDYKTARKITHIENDVDSCLQVLLYAYMLKETKNIEANCGEYRYLRYDKVIKCTFSSLVAGQIDELLGNLKHSLETGEYIVPEKCNECTYCEYLGICRKEALKND